MSARYDYYAVPASAMDASSIGTVHSSSRDPESPWNADYKDISPRFGMALRLDDSGKTVLRGGYGIFFSRQNLFTGAVEIVKDAVNLPFSIPFSRAELQRFGLNYGDPNSKAVAQFRGRSHADNMIDPAENHSQQWTLVFSASLRQFRSICMSAATRCGYPTIRRITAGSRHRFRPVAVLAFNYYQTTDSSNYNSPRHRCKRFSGSDL
jgi:hypothetical protein